MTQSATAARLDPAPTPKRGDIGVVDFARATQVAGIFSGRRWLIKTARGVVSIPAAPIVAWSL